jgi:hypothetical protein
LWWIQHPFCWLKEKEKETGAIVTLFMLQNGRLWPASYSSAHPKTDIQFTDEAGLSANAITCCSLAGPKWDSMSLICNKWGIASRSILLDIHHYRL